MNIALILHTTDPFMGATKAILRTIDTLQRTEDVRFFLVTPDEQGIYADFKRQGIPVVAINHRPCAYPSHHGLKGSLLFLPRIMARVVLNWRATRQLARYLRDNDIDIVHTNTSIVRFGFDCARKMRIPHVYHIREYADSIGYHYFPFRRSFHRQLERYGSYSICITKDVQRHYGMQQHNGSRVIYDGIRPSVGICPSHGDEGCFLYAGRIEPNKGLHILLKAYKAYVDSVEKVVPLHVAGATGVHQQGYLADMEQFIQSNGLQQHVRFLGERDDIDNIMQQARAIIIPSISEGFGLCMPEAMFNGCLTIGHNTTGTKEQMDNGLELRGAEIALRYNTSQELTELLIDVACKPLSRFSPYAERAFLTVNELYTTEQNAQNIFRFYRDIIDEGGRGLSKGIDPPQCDVHE